MMRSWFILVCSLSVSLAFSIQTRADASRTQTIQLSQGWNAVFLEVYPPDSDPEIVFTNTPVDIAATFYSPGSPAQFITDPSADLFRNAGWGTWYASERPDAFLATLHAIYGQQAYLIHSKSAFTWQVTGAVVPAEVRWQTGDYNLVGFSVHRQAPPSFAQFFRGSKALRHDRIYRLANGTWRRVLNPAAEAMRSGEAFWIYCDGACQYQGPLRVETTARQGVLLAAEADGLVLRNQTDHPISPTVEHTGSGTNSVPLSIVIQAVGDSAAPLRSVSAPQLDGPWTQPLPPLEAGRSVRVPLEVRRQDMNFHTQSSVLKISTDIGTEIWIPVIGVREDLKSE